MSTDRSMQVTRTLTADPESVFALLATPARHPELDGARMVRGLASGPSPVTAVGDVFVMDMHQDGIGDYQMRNEVVALEPGRRIGWAPTIHPVGALAHVLGDADPSGHTWTWVLEPTAEGGTTVTHTYDWSAVRDEKALPVYPRVSPEQLESSLDQLVGALE